MQLLGQPITHTTFGKGIVTDWNDHSITVCFNSGEKRFIYPDAFSNFLILKNTDAQEKIQHLIDESEENHKAKLHVPFDSVPRRGIVGYVGTFMVKDDFFGSDCTDGIIPAHSVYRLRLPLDQQPLFWLHVAGELAQQHWGKTAFKYLSNRAEETILFSLKDLPSPARG